MLISTGSIPYIHYILKWLRFSYKLLYPKFRLPLSLFNCDSPIHVYFSPNPTFRKSGKLQMLLLFCGSFSLALQAEFGKNSLTFSEYFVKIFCSYLVLCYAIFSLLYNNQLDNIANFCNQLCNFERTFIHTNRKLNKEGNL